MTWITMAELPLQGKRVLIREDLNVPLNANGSIADDTRIRASVETLQMALQHGAKVQVLSHLGRPQEGAFDPGFSLQVVATRLAQLLDKPVPLVRDWLPGQENHNVLTSQGDGEIYLLENVRFNVGEKADDPTLARQMASLCDIFVMDAFATAHRAQASTHGVAQFAPIACAGPLLCREIAALDKAIKDPKRPLVTLIGGAKIHTKLQLLRHLVEFSDRVLVGGGIANTLLLARGIQIGESLAEPDFLPQAKELLQFAENLHRPIPLPVDVVIAEELRGQVSSRVSSISQIGPKDRIGDIGPLTIASYQNILRSANTIVWNGPFGVAEVPAFATGTNSLIQTITQSEAYSLLGGGDTVAALNRSGLAHKISYISTGGGAFLTYLEGKELPGIQILQQKGENMTGGLS